MTLSTSASARDLVGATGTRERASVPDMSMLPGSEKAPPATVDLLNRAVQGAHDTIDRLAVAPVRGHPLDVTSAPVP